MERKIPFITLVISPHKPTIWHTFHGFLTCRG